MMHYFKDGAFCFLLHQGLECVFQPGVAKMAALSPPWGPQASAVTTDDSRSSLLKRCCPIPVWRGYRGWQYPGAAVAKLEIRDGQWRHSSWKAGQLDIGLANLQKTEHGAGNDSPHGRLTQDGRPARLFPTILNSVTATILYVFWDSCFLRRKFQKWKCWF